LSEQSERAPEPRPPAKGDAAAYWRANISLVLRCMAVWFFVSYGCGILFVDFLNQFRIGGFPLGFWFAQQGSILVFILLIAYYARAMTRLDREFDVDEE